MSTVGKHSEPVSGFSPLSFGGCVLWLDAASSNNFALTGSNITTWYDRSPFSNHATASNGSPILSNGSLNGRPSVYLSNAPHVGGSISLTNAGLTGFMVVTPLTVGAASSWQRWFSGAQAGVNDFGDTGRFFLSQQGGQSNLSYNRANAYQTLGILTPSVPHLASWAYDGASNYLFLNGAPGEVIASSALSAAAFNITRYAIGNQVSNTTETLNGYVAEVIIYNDYLQPAQRRAVEGYLAWKWGIAPALGTTFSPLTSLSNCAIWFDGADASTFTLSGSNITQWRDKAGSNVTSNIGTPVYTSNAINGVAGVLLDVNSGFKISPMSNAANTTTVSIYGVVAASSNSQNNARVFTSGRVADGQVNNDYSASSSWVLYRSLSNLVFGHTNAYVTSSNVLADQTPCLISAIFSGSTGTLWTNGSNIGSNNTTDTFTFDRLGIGKNTNPDAGTSYDAFAGTVGEFLIFYAAHTETQRRQVESYLASKWNVPMRSAPHLAPTHSYTTRRPFVRGFQPTDISSCLIWLDAADSNAFAFSSGSNVSLWRDKSPFANTFSNTGTVVRSSNAIVLSGSSYLRSTAQFDVGGTYTLIATKLTNGTGYVFLTGFDNIQPAATMGAYGIKYDIGILTAGGGGDYGGSYIVNGTSNATSVSPYTTTAPYASRHIVEAQSSQSGVTYFRLGGYTGGDRNYIGEIYEVLMFSKTPSIADRLRLQAYLAEKWGIRGLMGGPAHPFRYGPWGGLPASVPGGCMLWLDAADASTITLSGNTITQWRDKSGNGLHFSTASGSPTYSSNIVTFPTGVVMRSAASIALTGNTYVFIATKLTTGGCMLLAFDNIQPAATAGDFSIRYFSDILNPVNSGDFASSYTINGVEGAIYTASTYLARHIIGARSQAGGTTTVTLSSGLSGRFYLGEIYEVLMFVSPPSTTTRQQVEGYLAAKWGLSGSLSVSHPYRTGPQITVTPAGVPGCVLWLDSADTSTITLSGSNVTQWSDKSGMGLVAISNSSNALPTFTSNTVQFGPSQTLLVSNLPYKNTWTCVVAMNTVATGTRWLISPFPDANQVMMGMSQPGSGDKVYSGKLPGMPADITGKHIEITTGSPYAWVRDGTQLVSNSLVDSAVSSTVRLGIGANGDGGFGQGASQGTYQFYEMMIFSNVLTSTQRQQIEGYLAWKWGISSNLPGPSANFPVLTRSLTAEFDPRSIAPVGAWFDAADPAMIQFSSGSNVQWWLDKSGGGFHLNTVSTGGNYPTLTPNTLNGKPVVTFNGASVMQSLYSALVGTTPQTIFLVTRPASLTGMPFPVTTPNNWTGAGGPPYALFLAIASGQSNAWLYGSLWGATNGVSNALIASTTRTDIVSGSWKPNLLALSVNGTEYGSSTEAAGSIATRSQAPKMYVGAGWYSPDNYYRNWYTGYIAELLIVPSFLSSADRQRMEGYLAWKWGLQSQLPSNHLYSNVKF